MENAHVGAILNTKNVVKLRLKEFYLISLYSGVAKAIAKRESHPATVFDFRLPGIETIK